MSWRDSERRSEWESAILDRLWGANALHEPRPITVQALGGG